MKATDRAQAQAAAAETARQRGRHEEASEQDAYVATSRARVADALNLLLHEDRPAGNGRRELDRAGEGPTASASSASRNSFTSSGEPIREGEFIYGVLPRGDEPLDSYQAAYWPACFPVLFPYGDACDGILRSAPLHGSHWVRSLLERVDRMDHGAWRLQLQFIAV